MNEYCVKQKKNKEKNLKQKYVVLIKFCLKSAGWQLSL